MRTIFQFKRTKQCALVALSLLVAACGGGGGGGGGVTVTAAATATDIQLTWTSTLVGSDGNPIFIDKFFVYRAPFSAAITQLSKIAEVDASSGVGDTNTAPFALPFIDNVAAPQAGVSYETVPASPDPLNSGTVYTYAVSAVDGLGNESPLSASVAVTAP